MNFYRVISHTDEAMLSVDPLCVDQRDESVVQLLSRQSEGVIFTEAECCRFGVHTLKLSRIIKLVNLISLIVFHGSSFWRLKGVRSGGIAGRAKGWALALSVCSGILPKPNVRSKIPISSNPGAFS
jgi:hypothetical protein